jgi:cobalt/nickel transport system ATP-binding protein
MSPVKEILKQEKSSMHASPPLLELRNVSYAFPGQPAVIENCTFSIDTEKTGLIGANGCGKTTLLHLMVGLLKPGQGTILFNGAVVNDRNDYRALRKSIGFLFQNSNDQLFSPTVIEDVAFGPLNLGCTAEEARHLAREVLCSLGLKEFENRITHRLSGGEKKLVALATILVMKPRLLLLDEPTNNLDPRTRKQLMNILKDLDLARIIISHDWDFLEETTESLYTIEHGHLHRCTDGFVHEHKHVHVYGDKPHHHA